jgi:uncharacterized protein (TIGR02118 family)
LHDAEYWEGKMTIRKDTAQSPIAFPRRAALSLGVAAAAGLVAGTDTRAAAGGIKITVLYGAPKDPAAFEKYYLEKHMPLVYALKEIKRTELAVGLPGPDGKPPAFYRITELWFDSPEHLHQVAAMPEWKKIVEDVPNFASGGATVVISKIE